MAFQFGDKKTHTFITQLPDVNMGMELLFLCMKQYVNLALLKAVINNDNKQQQLYSLYAIQEGG